MFYFLLKFAILNLKLGEEANQFSNILDMLEVVLPFEWHSFCISIDIDRKQAALFHNGHIQAIQLLEKIKDDIGDEFKFLTLGHLGGAKFVGILTEFEVFGRPLSDQKLLQWTSCENKGRTSFCLEFTSS